MVPFGMIVTSENPLPATTNCSFPSKSSSFAAYKIEMLQFYLVNDLSFNPEPNEDLSSVRVENSHCFLKGRLYGTQGLYKVFTLCAALSRTIPNHVCSSIYNDINVDEKSTLKLRCVRFAVIFFFF